MVKLLSTSNLRQIRNNEHKKCSENAGAIDGNAGHSAHANKAFQLLRASQSVVTHDFTTKTSIAM
jgi:hypothetical protein